MRAPRTPGDRALFGIWWHALGYFAFYVPYAALTRALSAGLVPGTGGPVPGLEMLPATAIGNVAGMIAVMLATGWWRSAGSRVVLGVEVPWPAPATLASAAAAGVIIGTTTLAYSVSGAAILFMLLLLRGGVLIIAPVIDVLQGRRVHPRSRIALVLSFAALAVVLVMDGRRELTAWAIADVAAYIAGYMIRLHLMSRVAKVQDESVNFRYFIEEHLLAAPMLLAMLAAFAVAGPGEGALALRRGFSTFLSTPAAGPALLIGLLYECLYVFGTLIYLDHRENSHAIPVNRSSSVLAGISAAYVLHALVGSPRPSAGQLCGAVLVILALVTLSAPRREPAQRASAIVPPAPRLVLFVCSGNTCRSPIAAALARAEIGRRLLLQEVDLDRAPLQASSAGLSPKLSAPMTSDALAALAALGVPAPPHGARAVTPEIVAQAEVIYCATRANLDDLLARFPGAATKAACLDPEGDLPDPHGGALGVYVRVAERIRELVAQRLDGLALGA